MSDFPLLNASVFKSAQTPIFSTQGVSIPENTSVLGNLLTVVGKPEELLTKSIGKLFSNEPKYDFGRSPTSFANQLGFFDLFNDAGFPAPISLALGVAASVANPLDPFNKLTILSKSKKATAGDLLATAATKLDKGRTIIDAGKLASHIEDLKDALKAGELTAKQAKSVEKEIKYSTRLAKKTDSVNKELVKLQDKFGLEELLSSRKERNLISFTSPFSFEHLHIFGAPSNPLARATNIPNISRPLNDKAVEVVDKISNLGTRTISYGKGILKGLHKGVANNQAEEYMLDAYRQIRTKEFADNKKVSEVIMNSVNNLMAEGFTSDDLKALGSKLEKRLEPTEIASFRQALEDIRTLPIDEINRMLGKGVDITPNQLKNLKRIRQGNNREPAIVNNFLVASPKWLNKHPKIKLKWASGEIDNDGVIDELLTQGKLVGDKDQRKAELLIAESNVAQSLATLDTTFRVLTDEQKIALSVTRLTPQDIHNISTVDLDKFTTGKISEGNKHTTIVKRGNDAYIMVERPGISPKDEAKLKDIYGQQVFSIQQAGIFDYSDFSAKVKGSRPVLVAKKLKQVDFIRRHNPFTVTHLANLEAIATQLSHNRQVIRKIRPTDIMVGPDGAVQIINPDIIQTVKKRKRADSREIARNVSLNALKGLADQLGLSHNHKFPFLGSKRGSSLVKNAMDAQSYRSAGVAQELVNQDISYIGGYDLLRNADNARGHAAYLENLTAGRYNEGFESSNNISLARQNIRQQLLHEGKVTIEPVELVVDANGRVNIYKGMDNVTAALLEGLDVIPVKVNNSFDQKLNTASGYFTGPSLNMADIHVAHGPVTNDVGLLGVSNNYRLLDKEGKFILAEHNDVVTDVGKSVSSGLKLLLTAGLTDDQAIIRLKNLGLAESSSFVHEADSLLRFAKIIDEAESIDDIIFGVSEISEHYKNFRYNNFNTAYGVKQAEHELVKLKELVGTYYDELLDRGILLDKFMDNPEYVAKAALRGTVQLFDSSDNSLRLIDSVKSTQELDDIAKQFLGTVSNLEDINPYAYIKLEGIDGVKSYQMKDVVAYKRFVDILNPDTTIGFTNTFKEQLKSKGILVNPEKVPELIGGILLGKRTQGELTSSFTRPSFPFFITKAGDIVVGTGAQRNIPTLLDEVFQEGPQYFEEIGIINAGHVTLSNPLGSKMENISIANIKQLEKRVKKIAERLNSLGLSPSTVVDINTPFDRNVWKQMYGERVTIANILDKKFKLKTNPYVLAHKPGVGYSGDSYISPILSSGLEVKSVKLLDPKLQKVLSTLLDINDEEYVKAVQNMLPVSYYSSYLGRVLTREAREAIDAKGFDYINGRHKRKTVKNFEELFKQRGLTSLTTSEVNELVKFAQGKENIVSVVVKHAIEAYDKNISVKEAKTIVKLAEILPNGTELFVTDGFYATLERVKRGNKALSRKQLWDDFKSHHLLVEMTPKDYVKMKEERSPKLAKLDAEYKKLISDISQLENLIKEYNAKNIPQGKALTDLEQELNTATIKAANVVSERIKLQEEVTRSSGPTALSIDYGDDSIWLNTEDVERLVTSGIIKQDDIIGDMGNPMVKVPFTKYQADLDGAGMKVALFNKESEELLNAFFSMTKDKGQLDKIISGYDKILEIYKSWTLLPIPSYHLRNAFSSFIMGWLGDVIDPESFGRTIETMSAMYQFRKGKLTTEDVITKLGKTKIFSDLMHETNLLELYNKFEASGGFHGGIHFNEFTDTGNLKKAGDAERTLYNAGLIPSSEIAGHVLLDNPLLRTGISAASLIENHFRLTAYINTWRKTGSFDEAALAVKRVYYDYTDLNAFERDVLKRTMPFYSWIRKNIPRMLSVLVTDPIKAVRLEQFMNRVQRSAVPEGIDENSLPQYFKDSGGIVIKKSAKGGYWGLMSEGIFPLADAYNIFKTDGIKNTLLQGLTPFIKVPMEQLFGYSLWQKEIDRTYRKVEQFPGEPSTSYSLGNLGFSRASTIKGPLGVFNIILNDAVFKTFFRIGNEFVTKILDPLTQPENYYKESPDIMVGFLSLALGKAHYIDPEQTKKSYILKYNHLLSRYKSMRKNYLEHNNINAAQALDRIIIDLELSQPPKEK